MDQCVWWRLWNKMIHSGPCTEKKHEMPRVLNSSPEFCSTSCLILAKSLHFYEPQFPLLQHRVCCEKQWWNNKALLKLWSTIKLWIIKWCFPSQGFQSPLTKGDFSLMPPSWIPVYLSREAVPRSIWETSYSLGFPGERKRGLNGRREGGKSPREVHGTPAENQHLSFWDPLTRLQSGHYYQSTFHKWGNWALPEPQSHSQSQDFSFLFLWG